MPHKIGITGDTTMGGGGAGESAHPREGECWGVRGLACQRQGYGQPPAGMPGGIQAGSSRLAAALCLRQPLRLRAPHYPPQAGKPAAGMRQVRRPGARPGPGLGAIGQNSGQQLG
jgi:hypothetical protein